MGPTQISVAIIMVGVAVVVIAWFQSSQAAASRRRMTGMMARVGPGTAMLDDPRTVAIGNEARRRCKGRPREDLCDRWLAGEVEGGNAFCPNAATFDMLTEASARAG